MEDGRWGKGISAGNAGVMLLRVPDARAAKNRFCGLMVHTVAITRVLGHTVYE